MNMTLAQVQAAFHKVTQTDMVTVVQYHRSLYIYDLNDPRIAGRIAWMHELHQSQQAAAMFLPNLLREKRVFELSQTKVERTDVNYTWLTSDEVRVDMMDALMDVHNFSHGQECC